MNNQPNMKNEGEQVGLALNEFQEQCKRTIPKERSIAYNLMNFALLLGSEAGEVIGPIEKHLFQGHELDDENILEELGDVLRCVAQLCTLLGITLEEVATYDLYKFGKRYKDGFTSKESINRGK